MLVISVSRKVGSDTGRGECSNARRERIFHTRKRNETKSYKYGTGDYRGKKNISNVRDSNAEQNKIVKLLISF